MRRKFLVATDGSPAATAAVEAGVQLASEQDAGVTFLHVVEPDGVVAPPFGAMIAKPIALDKPEEDEPLAAAAEIARANDVRFDLRLVAGFDYETILATADEIDAILIAVGSNRHGALGTAFLGSVSQELLKRSRRPLLVVHPTSAPVPAAV
jgi:nucleotide-binding universal stress UspA family protein